MSGVELRDVQQRKKCDIMKPHISTDLKKIEWNSFIFKEGDSAKRFRWCLHICERILENIFIN